MLANATRLRPVANLFVIPFYVVSVSGKKFKRIVILGLVLIVTF